MRRTLWCTRCMPLMSLPISCPATSPHPPLVANMHHPDHVPARFVVVYMAWSCKTPHNTHIQQPTCTRDPIEIKNMACHSCAEGHTARTEARVAWAQWWTRRVERGHALKFPDSSLRPTMTKTTEEDQGHTEHVLAKGRPHATRRPQTPPREAGRTGGIGRQVDFGFLALVVCALDGGVLNGQIRRWLRLYFSYGLTVMIWTPCGTK
mmetsp:Transcript_107302/g.185138  ORF Transcript_107302/g.185138 Transcript_107302/m.185138 type:complete len:207 (+) Transcript_107302:149-769(+)